MISFLVSSLLSVCLLSPVQSPDCAGGLGVSVPPIPAPVTVQLPVPLPLPSVPDSPTQIITSPLPAPLPIPQPVYPIPAPAPIQPLPAPAPIVVAPEPVPAPEPVIPVEPPIEVPAPAPVSVPEPAVEVPPAVPDTVPTPTYDGLNILKTTNSGVEVAPTAPVTVKRERRGWLDGPFNDGSVGAAIGNAVLHFPDFGILLLIICGVGIALLTERLDENPKVQTKSELYD